MDTVPVALRRHPGRPKGSKDRKPRRRKKPQDSNEVESGEDESLSDLANRSLETNAKAVTLAASPLHLASTTIITAAPISIDSRPPYGIHSSLQHFTADNGSWDAEQRLSVVDLSSALIPGQPLACIPAGLGGPGTAAFLQPQTSVASTRRLPSPAPAWPLSGAAGPLRSAPASAPLPVGFGTAGPALAGPWVPGHGHGGGGSIPADAGAAGGISQYGFGGGGGPLASHLPQRAPWPHWAQPPALPHAHQSPSPAQAVWTPQTQRPPHPSLHRSPQLPPPSLHRHPNPPPSDQADWVLASVWPAAAQGSPHAAAGTLGTNWLVGPAAPCPITLPPPWGAGRFSSRGGPP